MCLWTQLKVAFFSTPLQVACQSFACRTLPWDSALRTVLGPCVLLGSSLSDFQVFYQPAFHVIVYSRERRRKAENICQALCSSVCKVRLFPPLSLNRRKLVPPWRLVVKTLCLQCKGAGLIPSRGTKIPRALGQGQKKKRRKLKLSESWSPAPGHTASERWRRHSGFNSRASPRPPDGLSTKCQ